MLSHLSAAKATSLAFQLASFSLPTAAKPFFFFQDSSPEETEHRVREMTHFHYLLDILNCNLPCYFICKTFITCVHFLWAINILWGKEFYKIKDIRAWVLVLVSIWMGYITYFMDQFFHHQQRSTFTCTMWPLLQLFLWLCEFALDVMDIFYTHHWLLCIWWRN